MTTPNNETDPPDGQTQVTLEQYTAVVSARDELQAKITELTTKLSSEETKSAQAQGELKKLQASNQELSANSSRLEELETENKTLKETNTANEAKVSSALAESLKTKGMSEDILKDKSIAEMELMISTVDAMKPETPATPDPDSTGVAAGDQSGTGSSAKTPLQLSQDRVATLFPQ